MDSVRTDVRIVVLRRYTSHNYKCDSRANSFENNWRHNAEDEFRVVDSRDEVLIRVACQTIANHPAYKYGDSLLEGSFRVRCFVPPRAFHGEIHGIIDAYDLEGQEIDHYSMQLDDGYQSGRWLIHDRYSFKTRRDTNYAWSGGCIILSSSDLVAINTTLRECGVTKGTVLGAVLREVKDIKA